MSHEGEARYRALAEHAIDVLFSSDDEGQITCINPAIRQFGFAPEQLLGKSLFGFVIEEDRPAVTKAFRRALLSDEESRSVFRVRTPNGDLRWVEERGRLAATGSPRQYIGAWRDITTQKQAEHSLRDSHRHLESLLAQMKQMQQQLVRQERLSALGQLTSGVAHDFNNLLMVVMGSLDFILKALPADSPALSDVNTVAETVRRASTLTQQLLAFSRQGKVEARVLDLNHTVSSMTKMLRRLLEENIRLDVVLHPTLPPILMDAGQIGQLLVNLTVNARDAMPMGGTLTIATDRVLAAEVNTTDLVDPPETPLAGEYVRIRIRDTGVGMSEDVQSRIFEPFFTTKDGGQGTGLGLSTVYGIVKQHKGGIAVSSAVNQGTVFTLYFPTAAHDAVVEATTVSRPPAPPGTETVLLVEDDVHLLRIFSRLLEDVGYRVLTAGDGATALRRAELEQKPIHLLMTDVVLPDINGSLLATRMEEQHRSMKVLFMSGYPVDQLAPRGFTGDIRKVLRKPLERGVFLREVRTALYGLHADGPRAS